MFSICNDVLGILLLSDDCRNAVLTDMRVDVVALLTSEEHCELALERLLWADIDTNSSIPLTLSYR